jgi:hypothetical protein
MWKGQLDLKVKTKRVKLWRLIGEGPYQDDYKSIGMHKAN